MLSCILKFYIIIVLSGKQITFNQKISISNKINKTERKKNHLSPFLHLMYSNLL